ncbi:Kinesin motor domain [Dillenia turbinata]|uniref:Kinesin motor domain n=1 Tax=Dillenia turbinata TaxID=194707 RepID=A0AAN8W9P9_9MAGN
MENTATVSTKGNGLQDFHSHLASRKAEEAAWRRFEAARWLEGLVGPIGVSSQPSEREFISCLRNGLVLCNAINKIRPGSVPKVVESYTASQSLSWDSQPLPAYQYFENVRNFLVAMEELKLPAFEACDLERDSLEAGSAAKVVDCILALKLHHELKTENAGIGFYKHTRSPLVSHSVSKLHSRAFSDSGRHLDMSITTAENPPKDSQVQNFEDSIVKAIAECMVNVKENVDCNLVAGFRSGNLDPINLFSRVISTCLEEQLPNRSPNINTISKDVLRKESGIVAHSTSSPFENQFKLQNSKDIKTLLLKTKLDFGELQSQLQSDLKHLGKQMQELSTTALQYHRVVKENQILYNMVQDLKGSIRVYCRIRPIFNAKAINVIDFIGDDGSLVIQDPLKLQKDGRKNFQFNHAFGPTSTQDEVFKETQPLIRSVMDGYNVCIFAYGQTGSGKTYTMCGPSCGVSMDMGINYLALNDLFRISDTRKDLINYEIHVQMVEIYNEQVRDLLAEDSSTTKYPLHWLFPSQLWIFNLEIRSCTGNGGFSLPDAKMHTVSSPSDVIKLMKLGEVNRAVSSTAINNRSSRSHSILTVHVCGKDTTGNATSSSLHLVDLAGSERVDKSEVTGERLKEAQHINKSLSCLGDVITALAQKNPHIPYRNSKLTQLLQDSLGGHAKTLMIAHVSPEGESFGETVGTLKFAQRVSTVELGAAHKNKESREVMELKEEIENLKKALANKEAWSTLPKERGLLFERPLNERTPPLPRRMSIENSYTMKAEVSRNLDERKGYKTPSSKAKPRTERTPTRLRRSSLEGQKCVMKDNLQLSMSGAFSKPLKFESATKQKYGHLQDVDTTAKQKEGTSMTNANCDDAPCSPISSTDHSRAVKLESRTKIPSLQLPRTPEQPILARNEVQIIMQSELTFSADAKKANLTGSTSGKGSQIRKSLRTIGRLINGSEKRSQPNPREARSPVRVTSNVKDFLSSAAINARTLRRQSLTGVQTLGSEKSRRSSLGGKSTDSYTKDNRNAKTPPPAHPSTRVTKRWM